MDLYDGASENNFLFLGMNGKMIDTSDFIWKIIEIDCLLSL